jgi:hypothetical protein
MKKLIVVGMLLALAIASVATTFAASSALEYPPGS